MARAAGRDIAELFGFSPDDLSARALAVKQESNCPFFDRRCNKTDHENKIIYGVCSVTKGSKAGPEEDVIICPERMYANEYALLKPVISDVWGSPELPLVIGGNLKDLTQRALTFDECVVAFGQRSGSEISAGGMSMDWVLQRYHTVNGRLRPSGIIGIEVQSIDITGNYRDPWNAYSRLRQGEEVAEIPNSEHGLNWANVHKRLIPQLIRKGNIYAQVPQTNGFFFLTPDVVFDRFISVLGDLPEATAPGPDVLSVRTVRLGEIVPVGEIRELIWRPPVHIPLEAVSQAFISHVGATAATDLERRLQTILDN